jgi:hypothetical protein
VGLVGKAKDKIQDAAGGVRAAEGDGAEDSQPNEARFEPDEVRRSKKPKDDLPQPEDFRPQD